MSWNGSGVYSRGYPSWSADAAANLPISATKFDTEDNDFASGIGLCLTKDGQSVPNAALTWGLTSGQVLALTRGSDGTVFSLARTGGTNNPSLAITLTDASGVVLSVLGNQALSVSNAGVVSFPSGIGSLTGPVTIAAPASGTALEVQAESGYQGLDINAASGASYQSFSLAATVQGIIGVANTSNALIVGAAANDLCLHSGPAGSAINFSTNNGSSIALSIAASTGRIAIAAPSSGAALTLTSVAGANGMVIDIAGSAAGLSLISSNGYACAFELTQTGQVSWQGYIPASSADLRFNDGTADRMVITAGSGVYLDGATGSAKGTGTLNAQALYANGAPLYSGIPQNAQSSSYTTVLGDANKHIAASGASTTITIAANASVAYPIGSAITIANVDASHSITIAITSDTIYWAPSGTTGSRTLAIYGVCTLLKTAATVWRLTGVGIT